MKCVTINYCLLKIPIISSNKNKNTYNLSWTTMIFDFGGRFATKQREKNSFWLCESFGTCFT